MVPSAVLKRPLVLYLPLHLRHLERTISPVILHNQQAVKQIIAFQGRQQVDISSLNRMVSLLYHLLILYQLETMELIMAIIRVQLGRKYDSPTMILLLYLLLLLSNTSKLLEVDLHTGSRINSINRVIIRCIIRPWVAHMAM